MNTNPADQMRLKDVRSEYLVPEAKPFLLAHVAHLAGRLKIVATYRRRLAPNMTVLDGMIAFQLFAFMVSGYDGTKASELVDSLDAPRRTIRSSLDRLLAAGVITRSADGLYHPTQHVANVLDDTFEETFRQIARVAESFDSWRRAIGR